MELLSRLALGQRLGDNLTVAEVAEKSVCYAGLPHARMRRKLDSSGDSRIEIVDKADKFGE